MYPWNRRSPWNKEGQNIYKVYKPIISSNPGEDPATQHQNLTKYKQISSQNFDSVYHCLAKSVVSSGDNKRQQFKNDLNQIKRQQTIYQSSSDVSRKKAQSQPLYILMSGKLTIVAKDEHGNDLPVHDLVCGEAFGYSDLFDVVVSFSLKRDGCRVLSS